MATLADDGTGVDRIRGDGEYSALGRIDFDMFGRSLTRWGSSNTAQSLRTFDSRAKVVRDAGSIAASFSPGEKWSFGYLMEQMANTPSTGVSGSALARTWLESWASARRSWTPDTGRSSGPTIGVSMHHGNGLHPTS